MKLLLATTNPHKLDEVRAVFAQGRVPELEVGEVVEVVEVVSLTDVGVAVDEPIEDGQTFEANAQLKAIYYASHAGMLTLADDSGLEVDALGGAPGVRSARYADASGPRREVDLANNAKLMRELEGVPAEERAARFVCAMALARPVDRSKPQILATVRGTFEGRILLPAEADDPARPELGRGRNGFGYDPLLLLPDLCLTSGELPPEQKNAMSHRGDAVRAMLSNFWAAMNREEAEGAEGRGDAPLG